jgi:hypothetical protein
MQAATIAAFGDLNVLNFGEVPTPSRKSGHVLIKIEAVGTNYYGTLVRSGAVSRTIPLPHVIDVVGHIELSLSLRDRGHHHAVGRDCLADRLLGRTLVLSWSN